MAHAFQVVDGKIMSFNLGRLQMARLEDKRREKAAKAAVTPAIKDEVTCILLCLI